MRMYQIILEFDRSKTLENYWSRLAKRMADGEKSFLDQERIMDWFESADPTTKKAYVVQLILWYLDGNIRYLEDVPKAKSALMLYSKFRNKLPPIGSLSFKELLDLADSLDAERSRAEMKREEEEEFYRKKQAVLYFENDNIKVVVPKTIAASRFFGKGTRWCTAANDNNMHHHYHRQGPLYIVMFKNRNKKKWQLHFSLSNDDIQVMDELDQDIEPEEYREEHDVLKLFTPIFMKAMTTKQVDPTDWCGYVSAPDALPEPLKDRACKSFGPNVRFFDNPSINMMKLAISDAPHSYDYIGHPPEEITDFYKIIRNFEGSRPVF